VEGGFRLALSGTPGTGKSTIASLLNGQGYTIISLESLANKYDCLGEVDSSDNSKPIDLEKLYHLLNIAWSKESEYPIIVDGHLSHQLPCDATVILRCQPDVLQTRLENRDYTKEKIQGNVEWELIGGPWNDKDTSNGWLELDTTEHNPNEILEYILKWIQDGFKPTTEDTEIDWIGRMEE
jgi:adenylate kinase|tara:strand:- start:2771 stop:3313 length:543 start_codon:yes stop_codon:yes gene_type:complete